MVALSLKSLTDKITDEVLEQLCRENPDEEQVEIYRQGQDIQLLSSPIILSGEDFLPGLTVDLAEIFA